MRAHFIELHEQRLLPSTIRDEVMDAMQFGLELLRVYEPVVPVLQDLIDLTGSERIVDLCSGAGGPWFNLASKLQRNGYNVELLLTDKFPNEDTAKRARSIDPNTAGKIAFSANSVDALHIPEDLSGLRTMFSSFHHFRPDDARAILQNAINAHKGICVFEVSRRDAATIALMFPWALIPFFVTPWIRPFRWSRLIWTYVIPIIPLILLFDGVVSCLRSYRTLEVREMVESLTGTKYKWTIQELTAGKPLIVVSCLTGRPET